MGATKVRIAALLALSLGLLALVADVSQALASGHAVVLTGLRTLQASPQDVVVSEIAWMGTATSPNAEWIELYNNTGSPIDLSSWGLSAADGTPSISLNGTIPADGYFLLERNDDESVPGVTADQIYNGGLENDGEDLVLRDAVSTVIDKVNCSSGWFSGHGGGRVPMVRVNAGGNGSQASNWTHNPRCGTATNSAGVSRTCTLTVTHAGQAFDYAEYFNERAITATGTTTDHTPMEDALLASIYGATTSIDVALYGLNRQSIVDALIAAHDRGVTVRVVGDDEAATGDYRSSYQTLTDAGVTVVTDTSTGEIQHNKFLVFDGEAVWTGSANFTDTGLTLNANNSIVITDTTLAGIYTVEFEEMWRGTFHGAKADNTVHLLDFDGTRLESYFSPTDLVAFEVWDELARADETIHFAMFFWTDEVLASRVVERLGAGVQVYGVWDQLGAAHPSSADEALRDAGAHIRIEDFAGKAHHKFAVIDVEGSDPVVILGSYNWTDGGAYDNDENTLIIHDRGLARAYCAEWQRLWSALGTWDSFLPPVANVVTAYYEAFNAGHLDGFVAFFSEDAVVDLGPFGTYAGHEEIRAWAEPQMTEENARLEFEVIDVEGDRVTVRTLYASDVFDFVVESTGTLTVRGGMIALLTYTVTEDAMGKVEEWLAAQPAPEELPVTGGEIFAPKALVVALGGLALLGGLGLGLLRRRSHRQ